MASSEQLVGGSGGPRYVQMQSEPSTPPSQAQPMASFFSFPQGPTPESTRIFDELPKATIVSVSRPDASDISPVLLSYTIEVQYKQARSLLSLSLSMRRIKILWNLKFDIFFSS